MKAALRDPILLISIRTRLGIVLGIVLLMTLKASLVVSLVIIVLAAAIGLLAGQASNRGRSARGLEPEGR